jgi:glucosamine--fructose-6-phosphate aminotransferase (isomerizing)
MCGIVAYIGHREAYPILIKGLKRLEYRGYDSAGVALLNGNLSIYKTKGKVADLEGIVSNNSTAGSIGMGHTRWATHGEPNDANSHPHLSGDGTLAIIHNGIIENYATLKEELINRGHTFKSDTDTEVLIHLIEEVKNTNQVDLNEAVRIALHEVVGAYAIVVVAKDSPNKLIGARKGSPMVVGIGDGEYFIASDASPIIEYTKDVTYLNDGEIAFIEDGKLTIKTIDNIEKTPAIQRLEMNLEAIEKGGYEYFMLKEIYEQPKSIFDHYVVDTTLRQAYSLCAR